MEQLFIYIFNMSLTAGIMVLAVIFVRLCLRRAPKIFSYCLWAVVLFRLLCPFSFQSEFSFLGLVQGGQTGSTGISYLSKDLGSEDAYGIPGGGADTDQWQAGLTSDLASEAGADGEGAAGIGAGRNGTEAQMQAQEKLAAIVQKAVYAGARIWVAGMAAMVVYSIGTLLKLKRSLRDASLEKENIYTTDRLSTPFVIGMIKPQIYLPAVLQEQEKEYVLLHERTHIRRGDHIFKMIGFLALCVHWFNPLVWAAFFLSGKDMEMSCDEAVLRKLGKEIKKEYSASLLNFATGRRIVSGVPLAFGEGDTGSRIKNVLAYKKPAAAAAVILAVVCIGVSAVLLANPKPEEQDTRNNQEAILPSQVYYGVVSEIELEGAKRQVLTVPGIGEVQIPTAKEFLVYFERPEQELLNGDVVELTFPQGEDVSVPETYPAGFSINPDTMKVIWSGCGLKQDEAGTYSFTFPAGVVKNWKTLSAGDRISIIWEEMSQEAVPELLASADIVEIGGEADRITFMIHLPEEVLQKVFAGFGTNISFVPEDMPDAPEETGEDGETAGQENRFELNVRRVSAESRSIEAYVGETMESLPFADGCTFRINYGIDVPDYREVSFDVFAAAVNGENEDAEAVFQNQPCILTFEAGEIVQIDLGSAYYRYGLAYSPMNWYDSWYYDIQELEGEDVLEEFYKLANTKKADVAEAEGEETIDVYAGNIGDGDSGIVLVSGADRQLLYSMSAHSARAGWNNIYLGEQNGEHFLMILHIEDREDYGEYGYWVFRLGMQTEEIQQIAGSTFTWDERSLLYDDELFGEWADCLESYLADCTLLLSTQEGVLRTEEANEIDIYNYETLKR